MLDPVLEEALFESARVINGLNHRFVLVGALAREIMKNTQSVFLTEIASNNFNSTLKEFESFLLGLKD